jgi:hypothetical protein
MAVTLSIKNPHPRRWVVDITETSTSDGETRTITPETDMRFPQSGRIVRISAVLSSGDATQISPILTAQTDDFTGPLVVIEPDPGTEIDEAPEGGIPYGLIGNDFYYRSNPNIGSNNAIRTRILIEEGWGE